MKEAYNYFNKKSFKKLFSKFFEKYQSFGYFTGRINLSNFTKEEIDELKGFITIKLDQKSITWNMMEKALKNSKFENLNWEDIISNVLNKKLISKKEIREKETKEKNNFFNEILKDNEKNIAYSWLKDVIENKSQGNNLIIQKYNQDKEDLKYNLFMFFKAVDIIKENSIYTLPTFATKVSNDPHFFDEGNFSIKLLSLFLENYYKLEKMEDESLSEYRSRILEKGNIIKDELSNDVLLYGIRAKTKDNKGHLGINSFYENKEPIKLTIYNLQKLKNLYANDNKVYIFENPAIFLNFLDSNKTLICGNGQIRRAVYMAIDLFSKDTIFYYSGDLDPEGLLIAQNLKDRYKERLKFLNYDKEKYLNNLSSNEISEARLKKLDLIRDEKLSAIKEEMLKYKKSSYQEQILLKIKNN